MDGFQAAWLGFDKDLRHWGGRKLLRTEKWDAYLEFLSFLGTFLGLEAKVHPH